MVKKLLKLKFRVFIFALLFLGAFSVCAKSVAAVNTSFSILNTKAVVKTVNNTANIYGENITFSGNVSFVNYLWADTPIAEAGFKEVFQKLEVVLLKGEVVAAPTVVTNAITIIAGTTATFNGEITVLGSPDIVQHGFCWNTIGSPSTADFKTELGIRSSNGTFLSNISGLNECTTYYVRAYADNGTDLVYGNEVAFTTDITKPTLTAITDRNENIVASCSFTIPDYTSLTTAADNCTAVGSIVKTQSPIAGTSINGHNTTQLITITADDGNGNTETTTFTITLKDVTAPVTPTLADVNIGQCSGTPTAPTTTDACAGTITGTTTTTFPITTQGITVVTWTFDDGNGNTTTANQNFTVDDTTKPTLTAITDRNENIVASCSFTIPDYTGLTTAADNCTDVGSIVKTQSPIAGTAINGHNTTQLITITADDGNGNTETTTFTITLKDVTAPVTPTLADVNIGQCSGTPTAPTTTDACAGTITGTTTTTFPITTQGITVVTWTFNDGNGNTTTANQNVTVDDTTKPTLTAITDRNENIVASCSFTIPDYTGLTTASDNCTAVGSITKTQSPAISTVISGHNTTQLITITADDGNGNTETTTFTITLKDVTAPVTPTLADVNIGQCSGTPTAPTTTDACAGTITGTTTTTFPITTQGTTVVTWNFADGNGNSTTANQNVIVDDTTKPTLTAIADRNENVGASCSFTIPDYTSLTTAADNCTAVGSIVKTQLPAVGTVISGHNTTQLITITANDGNGNTETTTFTVTLKDVTPPTAVCKPITVQLVNGTANISPIDINNGSSDNCGTPTLVSVSPSNFTCADVGANVVTLTVRDDAGNLNSCTTTVTVEDKEVPDTRCIAPSTLTLILDPITGTVSINSSQIDNGSNDECGIASLSVSPTTFDCTNIGINTVILTATDNNGNTSICSTTIIINPPTIITGGLTGTIVNPIPDNPQPASNLIEVTACPGGILAPKDVELTLDLTGSNINASNISTWQISTNQGTTWTDVSGTSGQTTITLIGLSTTTLVRAFILSGSCPSISPYALIRFLPPDEPPIINSISNTTICLGTAVDISATSFFEYGGQFGGGGYFNQANPDNWLVDGVEFFPAPGNNTNPANWFETNGPRIFGGIRYDTGDNTKFAVANGMGFSTTMETPIFSTIGMAANEAILEFYQAYYFCNGAFGKIELSLDGGDNYDIVLNTDQNDNLTSGNESGFSVLAISNACGSGPQGQHPTSDPFQPASIDLSSYLNEPSLRIKFTYDATLSTTTCNVNFAPGAGNTCNSIPSNFNVHSAWVIDDVGFPYAPIDEVLEWTDEDGNVIAIGNNVSVTPVTPGIREFGVTTLVNGCRADTDAGTEFINIYTSLAFAGKDHPLTSGKCGESTIQLNAYDNTKTAVQNYNNGAWESDINGQGYYIVPNVSVGDTDYQGTGVTGKWSIVSAPTSSCGSSGTFSSDTDPRATFTGESGTYVLRWELNDANACSDDVTVEINNCNNIDFDGVDDYVTFKNNYNLNGPFSIEAWIKPNATSGTIFSRKDNAVNTVGYDLSLNNGSLVFNYGNGSISTASIINTTRWFHVAVTYDGTNYKLYVDGVLKNTVSGSAPQTTPNNIEAILGAIDQSPPSDPVNYYTGWMDEFRVWNKALSVDHIRQMMNQEIKSGGVDVIGEVIPYRVSGPDALQDGIEDDILLWANLDGYYRMAVGCGYLTAYKGVSGRLRNIYSTEQQTAPIPYTSATNGNWDTMATWAQPVVWNAPNTKDVDNTPIDWNIVKISNDITASRDLTLLGLISQSGELTMEGITDADGTGTGQGLWITHYLKLDGQIDLVGESQLVQKRYTPSQFSESIFEPTSSGYIERDQQGQKNSFNYNYWSSPVTRQGAANNAPYKLPDVLRDGTDSSNPETISFVDGAFSADGALSSPIKITSRWIWTYRATIGTDPWANYYQWVNVGYWGSINVGDGYTMKGTGGSAGVTAMQNYVFVGKPNSGDITTTQLNPNQIYLIGNPYPSALDADEFILDNIQSTIRVNNVDKVGRNAVNVFNGALYFWDHFRNTDNHFLAQYSGGYATYTLMGGIKAIADTPLTINDGSTESVKIPSRYIPVGQAFFVEAVLDPSLAGTVTSVPGGTLVFKNSQRVFEREATGSSVFMKGVKAKGTTAVNSATSVDVRPKVRLQFNSPLGYQRGLLVGVDERTTNNFDIGFDAPLNEENKEDMFWQLGKGKLVIQGVNNFDENQELPLGLKISKTGLATIKIEEVKYIDENVTLHIKDKVTGKTHNISYKPFEIELEPGTYLDRFALIFKYQKLVAEDLGTDILSVEPVIEDPNYHVFMNNARAELQIKNNGTDEIRGIIVYNNIGQVMNTWNKDLNRRIISLPVKLSTGVYVVQINTINGTINKRIIIE